MRVIGVIRVRKVLLPDVNVVDAAHVHLGVDALVIPAVVAAVGYGARGVELPDGAPDRAGQPRADLRALHGMFLVAD